MSNKPTNLNWSPDVITGFLAHGWFEALEEAGVSHPDRKMNRLQTMIWEDVFAPIWTEMKMNLSISTLLLEKTYKNYQKMKSRQRRGSSSREKFSL